MPLTLTLSPIEDAPAESGLRFGPCLALDPERGWQIACWDGCAWWNEVGEVQLAPVLWAHLPQRRERVRNKFSTGN